MFYELEAVSRLVHEKTAHEKVEIQKKIQQRLLGIIAEKLHTKFKSAAMTECWVEVDLK